MLVSVAMLVKYNEAKLNQILITGNGFNLDIDLDGEFLSIKDFSELKDIIKKLLEKKLNIETNSVDLKIAKDIFKDNRYKLKQLLQFGNNVPIILINNVVDINYNNVEEILNNINEKGSSLMQKKIDKIKRDIYKNNCKILKNEVNNEN